MVISATCQPANILTLARADELRARASLSATQAAGVKLDTAVEVRVAERAYQGRIDGLTALVDGRYLLEVALPRADGMLAGQAASIRLP